MSRTPEQKAKQAAYMRQFVEDSIGSIVVPILIAAVILCTLFYFVRC